MEYARSSLCALLVKALITINLNAIPIHCVQLSLNCECGVENTAFNNRIVGGSPTEANAYPWLVEITANNSLYCGGSLINNRYVLTAGHCVYGVDQDALQVVIGRHNRRSRDGFKVDIDRVILHDNFIRYEDYDENDIALLRLRDVVTFSKTVSPVCLPHPGSKYGGLPAFVIGWGRIYPHLKKTSDRVLKGNVRVLHDYRCKKSTIGFGYRVGNICAYNDNIDACQGDSGSPLVYKTPVGKHEIIGVVSWGLDCATMDTPGVYARVPYFVRWILRMTRDGKYCKV